MILWDRTERDRTCHSPQIPEIPKAEEEIRLAFNEFVDKYEKHYQHDETGL